MDYIFGRFLFFWTTELRTVIIWEELWLQYFDELRGESFSFRNFFDERIKLFSSGVECEERLILLFEMFRWSKMLIFLSFFFSLFFCILIIYQWENDYDCLNRMHDAKSFRRGIFYSEKNIVKKKEWRGRIASFVFTSDAFLVCFPFYRSRSL